MVLADYLNLLARDLTDVWQHDQLDTGLYVHVAGVANGEPTFRFVNNIGHMEGLRYVDIGRLFKAVNDLDDYLVPRWASFPVDQVGCPWTYQRLPSKWLARGDHRTVRRLQRTDDEALRR